MKELQLTIINGTNTTTISFDKIESYNKAILDIKDVLKNGKSSSYFEIGNDDIKNLFPLNYLRNSLINEKENSSYGRKRVYRKKYT